MSTRKQPRTTPLITSMKAFPCSPVTRSRAYIIIIETTPVDQSLMYNL
nr:hypothetical protein Q903MT_gene2485 [Picea sitchensis]